MKSICSPPTAFCLLPTAFCLLPTASPVTRGSVPITWPRSKRTASWKDNPFAEWEARPVCPGRIGR
jgi:hypothetical protein